MRAFVRSTSLFIICFFFFFAICRALVRIMGYADSPSLFLATGGQFIRFRKKKILQNIRFQRWLSNLLSMFSEHYRNKQFSSGNNKRFINASHRLKYIYFFFSKNFWKTAIPYYLYRCTYLRSRNLYVYFIRPGKVHVITIAKSLNR